MMPDEIKNSNTLEAQLEAKRLMTPAEPMTKPADSLGALVEVSYCVPRDANTYASGMTRMWTAQIGDWLIKRLTEDGGPILVTGIRELN